MPEIVTSFTFPESTSAINCDKLISFSFCPLLPAFTTCQSRKAEITITNQKITVFTVEFTKDSCRPNLPTRLTFSLSLDALQRTMALFCCGAQDALADGRSSLGKSAAPCSQYRKREHWFPRLPRPSHFTCFWSFHPVKIVEAQGNLSAWKWPVRSCNVGQVPAGLFYRPQAIANQEGLIDQKPEIIRLQLNSPCRLPVQKRS